MPANEQEILPTLRQYALRCGCSQQQLRGFVEGKSKSIDNDTLDALAMLTGVDPEGDEEEAGK